MREVDVLIVGGGPAGLAAATWLARYRRTVLVVDSGVYRNESVEVAHGYLGWDPMNPAELRERARADLLEYPTAQRCETEVRAIRREDEQRFTAVCSGEPFEVTARAVILATGTGDAYPDVANFGEHYGASIFHCPTCDGYEARDRDVVILGWSPNVAGFARHLMQWASSTTIVTNGHSVEIDDADHASLRELGVEVIEDSADEFLGSRGDLRGVRLGGGRTVPCSLAFFTVAHKPHRDLAVSLGCELAEDGSVQADFNGRTSQPWVWAAGDLTPGPQLVSVAAAKGTAAGVCCALGLAGLD